MLSIPANCTTSAFDVLVPVCFCIYSSLVFCLFSNSLYNWNIVSS
nr:MAG TPA: hypothetical protein [Caudoviricetes sp.]